MIDLKNLTIQRAHEAMKKGEYTCRELLDAYIKNIKEQLKKHEQMQRTLSAKEADVNVERVKLSQMFEELKPIVTDGMNIHLTVRATRACTDTRAMY